MTAESRLRDQEPARAPTVRVGQATYRDRSIRHARLARIATRAVLPAVSRTELFRRTPTSAQSKFSNRGALRNMLAGRRLYALEEGEPPPKVFLMLHTWVCIRAPQVR